MLGLGLRCSLLAVFLLVVSMYGKGTLGQTKCEMTAVYGYSMASGDWPSQLSIDTVEQCKTFCLYLSDCTKIQFDSGVCMFATTDIPIPAATSQNLYWRKDCAEVTTTTAPLPTTATATTVTTTAVPDFTTTQLPTTATATTVTTTAVPDFTTTQLPTTAAGTTVTTTAVPDFTTTQLPTTAAATTVTTTAVPDFTTTQLPTTAAGTPPSKPTKKPSECDKVDLSKSRYGFLTHLFAHNDDKIKSSWRHRRPRHLLTPFL